MGMRLAARLLLLASAVCSGSCLVVSDPDFRGQEDCIPFFVTQSADPSVSDTSVILTSAGELPRFKGSVLMRSCALTKTYQMRVFLDGGLVHLDDVPPTGEEQRPVTALVDFSGALPGCHDVEIYLSTRFTAIDPRQPERQDDLAYILWRFADTGNASFTDCGSR
jgi:hypothetical protein